MSHQVGDPLAVLHVGLVTGHVPDVVGVAHDDLEGVLENRVHGFPVNAGALRHFNRAMPQRVYLNSHLTDDDEGRRSGYARCLRARWQFQREDLRDRVEFTSFSKIGARSSMAQWSNQQFSRAADRLPLVIAPR